MSEYLINDEDINDLQEAWSNGRYFSFQETIARIRSKEVNPEEKKP
jgi:hypothetical protein